MPTKRKAPEPRATAPNRAAEVEMDVSVELGRVRVPLERLLTWREGSTLELSKVSGDPADVLVNGEPFAWGEVVTVGESFGVRLTKILNRDAV